MPEIIAKAIEQMPADAAKLSMRLGGSSDTLALVRRMIEACVCHLDLPAAVLNDIKLAATEACTNVIKHAYHFDASKSFEFEITSSPEVFLAEVLYSDPGFVPEKIPVPNFKEIKEGGLGVYIIRSIMDHVVYQTAPDGTVKLSILKLLKVKNEGGGQK